MNPARRPACDSRLVSMDGVAAAFPPEGGRPEISRIETTEKAMRRWSCGYPVTSGGGGRGAGNGPEFIVAQARVGATLRRTCTGAAAR